MVIYCFAFQVSLAADQCFYQQSVDEVLRVAPLANEPIMSALKSVINIFQLLM